MMDIASATTKDLLATALPGRSEQLLALAAILLSVVCLALMAPFARMPLTQVPAFIPAYEAALAVNDLITAILLFGQFHRTSRFSLLAAASGYLFDAMIVVIHALSFPGVFAASGLLGAGSQTTAWLYAFWHGMFPAFILAYALMAGTRMDVGVVRRGAAVTTAIAGVSFLVAAFTVASTVGEARLPVIVSKGDYSRMVTLGVSPAILLVTVLAIAAMWRRRKAAVLDLWLFTVLWIWLCDVSLSALVGSSRYDLGWYGGRLFGLLAASFVLCSLLFESSQLYGRLEQALATAEEQNAKLIRSRAELARVQRLEAIGQVTGGVAHDFNNLLTAILGALEMISRRPGDQERVAKLAASATKAANRGARLVRQLMTFARQQALRPEVLNPNLMLLEFEIMTGLVAGEPVTVTLQLDDAAHPIRVDTTEFQSALFNLVSNARDAMPAGGSLTIESRNVRLNVGDLADNPDVLPGEYVMVAVSDTGGGMDAETRAKVFEPFFTTKPVGSGTGLGMSHVYGFAKSAEGAVEIDSAPGCGTTVRLYLPRSNRE